MSGKSNCRPSLRRKTLKNVKSSSLSKTDKNCIEAVFTRYENAIMQKCQNPDGELILIPDQNGVFHELDLCDYEVVEAYRNVTVEVLRCKKCGHIEISWKRQDNTEVIENDEL